MLLKNVANLFTMSRDNMVVGTIIKKFVSYEQKREVEKAKARTEKSETRKKQKIKDHKNSLQKKAQNRRARDVAKYGNFEWR